MPRNDHLSDATQRVSPQTTAAPVSRKKWVRAPIFGPARVRCYGCGHRISIPFFGAVESCSKCGDARFDVSY